MQKYVVRRNPKREQAELKKSWDKLVAAHAKPLEKGGTPVRPKERPPEQHSMLHRRETTRYPSLDTGGTATKPLPDASLQQAIREQSAFVGMAYNKGGLQYLTPAERAEQRTGSHKRRS